MGKTVHEMGLYPVSFEKIKNGSKTIELRLYDEKRQAVQVGDVICFVNSEDSSKKLKAEVVGLFIFDSFDRLYRELPLTQCGYTPEEAAAASPRDMDSYYSKEKQEKYSVVGIKVRLLDIQADTAS